MIHKGMVSIAVLSFGMLACSGGGGSTDTTSTTTTTTTPVSEVGKTPSGIPLIAAPTAKTRFGSTQNLSTFHGGIVPEEQRTDLPGFVGVRVSLFEKVTLSDGRVVKIWGTDPGIVTIDDVIIKDDAKLVHNTYTSYLHDTVGRVAVSEYSYFDKNGKAYSFYAIDDRQIKDKKWTARPITNWTWTGVNYSYTTINQRTGDTFASPEKEDGSIVVYDGKWDANFGKVKLNGTITGNEVAGTATGNFYGQNLTGKFAGVDGVVDDFLTSTIGGFAGGNSEASFAGTWVENY